MKQLLEDRMMFWWSVAAYLVSLVAVCWICGGAARLGGPDE